MIKTEVDSSEEVLRGSLCLIPHLYKFLSAVC